MSANLQYVTCFVLEFIRAIKSFLIMVKISNDCSTGFRIAAVCFFSSFQSRRTEKVNVDRRRKCFHFQIHPVYFRNYRHLSCACRCVSLLCYNWIYLRSRSKNCLHSSHCTLCNGTGLVFREILKGDRDRCRVSQVLQTGRGSLFCLNTGVCLSSKMLVGQFSELERKQQHSIGIFKPSDWLSTGVKLNTGSWSAWSNTKTRETFFFNIYICYPHNTHFSRGNFKSCGSSLTKKRPHTTDQ